MEFGEDGEWGVWEELGREQEKNTIKIHCKKSSKEFLEILY